MTESIRPNLEFSGDQAVLIRELMNVAYFTLPEELIKQGLDLLATVVYLRSMGETSLPTQIPLYRTYFP